VKFIQHPSNNAVLASPSDMTVEQCRPLPITRVEYGDGTPAVWSFWQPTDAERAAIRFEALGHSHPPISLSVDGMEHGDA